MALTIIGGLILWIAFIALMTRILRMNDNHYNDLLEQDEWERFQRACASTNRARE